MTLCNFKPKSIFLISSVKIFETVHHMNVLKVLQFLYFFFYRVKCLITYCCEILAVLKSKLFALWHILKVDYIYEENALKCILLHMLENLIVRSFLSLNFSLNILNFQERGCQSSWFETFFKLFLAVHRSFSNIFLT